LRRRNTGGDREGGASWIIGGDFSLNRGATKNGWTESAAFGAIGGELKGTWNGVETDEATEVKGAI
jgi:hypothetical protein